MAFPMTASNQDYQHNKQQVNLLSLTSLFDRSEGQQPAGAEFAFIKWTTHTL